MTVQAKFSPLSKLTDLEEVVNTRTPVYDIGRDGDVCIKLDTDVNNQEWYVLFDDRSREPLYGIVLCYAFPHFNGAHDQYRYEPAQFCFKTFAELLEAHPTERAIWGYDLEEYARRTALKDNDPFLPDYPDEDTHPHLKLLSRERKPFLVTMTAANTNGETLTLYSRGDSHNSEEAIHYALEYAQDTHSVLNGWTVKVDSCVEEDSNYNPLKD